MVLFVWYYGKGIDGNVGLVVLENLGIEEGDEVVVGNGV